MPRTRRRNALAAWYSRYLNPPRYRDAQRLRLTTEDGVVLHAVRLAGPPDCGATVVVVHGFANWHRHPPLHRFVNRLKAHTHVIVVDLRGHGASRGVSTLGACEWLDVAAAVREVDDSDALILLGMSMGAGASVVYAGRAARDTTMRRADAVVAISGPARWGRVLELNHSFTTRAVLRLMRVRIGRGSRQARVDPIELVGAIAPAPVIVVHDRADWYFGPEHPESMVRAAGSNARLWWRTGGHASDLLTETLLDDLLEELRDRGVLHTVNARRS